jgi:hypothetical protein
MTLERAARLTALGFVWDALDGAWEAQLGRLADYKAANGDCVVPKRYAKDMPLGRWVNHQRRGKKMLDRGVPAEGMTAERAAKLEALGFVWDGSKAHPNEAQWEAQLARLTAYRATHSAAGSPSSGRSSGSSTAASHARG